LHRALIEEILVGAEAGADSHAALEAWKQRNAGPVERCLGMIADIRASRVYDTTTLPVALREVANLIRGGGSAEGPVGDGALARVGAESTASLTAPTT